MSILNLKKNKAAEVAPKKTKKLVVVSETKVPAVSGKVFPHSAPADIIVRPRVTEKATVLSELGRAVYVFEVSRLATKRTVTEAIRVLYKVSTEKVAILKIPPKKSMVRGRVSRGKTYRKAYVYLKKGETIDLA